MSGLLAWMNLGPLAAITAEAQGLAPFDLRPMGYGEPEARAFLAAISPEGRALYLGLQHRLDTAYPPLLALVLIWSYFALLSRPWAMGAAGIAVLAAAVDLVENARVAGLLLSTAPTASEIAAASQASLAKTALVSLALVLLALSAARAALQRFQRR